MKKNHAPTDNKSMTLNFKKIRDACGNDSSSPKAIARSDVLSNQTTIIDVIFRNVSWQTAGDYVITLNFGHTTRERHFTVNVYGKGIYILQKDNIKQYFSSPMHCLLQIKDSRFKNEPVLMIRYSEVHNHQT